MLDITVDDFPLPTLAPLLDDFARELIDGATADASADIYGLGCVAYWLLTGTFVFESESPLAMAVRPSRLAASLQRT